MKKMIPFAEEFPDWKIVVSLIRQLVRTKLLPKAQLERKLHQAVRLARAALARRSLTP